MADGDFTGCEPRPASYPPAFRADDCHGRNRFECHRITVAGRVFGLDVDHGHKAACCALPPVPASVVWWEALRTGGDQINCGNTRACLMMEFA